MSSFDTQTKAETVTSENYIDVKHEYFGIPNDEGLRLRTRDVWFATRPTVPEYHVVDKDDNPIPEFNAEAETAWTIAKVGLPQIIICDRDDINGLRALLDALEHDFDRRDMEQLQASLDNPPADEEEDVD